MRHDKLIKKVTNLSGLRVGRWTVLPSHSVRVNGKHRATYWLCRCECGNEKEVWANALVQERSKSCGCLNRDMIIQRNVGRSTKWPREERSGEPREKGKRANAREYGSWCNARRRCYNQSDKHYALYGGRGITMCDRWRDDFAAFLDDMAACPPRMTLDRIDTDGNYEPVNCRWATQKTQCRNKRCNHVLEYNGISKSIAAWAEDLGMTINRLYYLTATRGHSLSEVIQAGNGEGLRER